MLKTDHGTDFPLNWAKICPLGSQITCFEELLLQKKKQ